MSRSQSRKVAVSEVGFVAGVSTELEVALSEYLIAIKQAGYSDRTIFNYGWHLERLLKWLSGRGVTAPGQVTRVLLREWGASLYDRWQPATIKQAVSATRSLFKWLRSERLLSNGNPAEALRIPKVTRRVQRTLTLDEAGRLLDVCDIATVKGLRDRAIISLLYDSGLRAAELCRLRMADLDLDAQRFQVRVKGGDERMGWFGEATAIRLRAWLRVRMVHPIIKTVFVSIGGIRPGYPLTVNGLFRILRTIGDKAGVPRVSTHSFRRGFAVTMTQKKVPNSVLMDLGRWEDPKMIKQYTLGLRAGEVYKDHAPMDDT